MSTTTEAVAVEATETNEVPAPFLTFRPNRTKLDPKTYVGDDALWVTTSPAGKDRAAIFPDGSDAGLVIGQVIEAKHVSRKSSYGLVTVKGKLVHTSAEGDRVVEGDVPDGNLSLRIAALVTPVAAAAE